MESQPLEENGLPGDGNPQGSGGRPRVRAVIITYQSEGVISAALEALEPAYRNGLLECRVVDNASTDGTAERVARYPWVELVASPFNVGFGRGANLGAYQATTEFVLVLNADAVLPLDALERLLAEMDARPGAGVVAPALQNEDGGFHDVRPLPTPGSILRAALPFSGGPAGVELLSAGDPARRVAWVPGAVLLVRRELFESCGGFDDRFFLYFEETDFLRRAARTRWPEVWAVGEAHARHVGGASTRSSEGGKVHGDLARYFFPSRLHYLSKEHGVVAAALVDLLEWVLLFLRELLRRLAGRGPGKLAERRAGPFWTWPGPVVPVPELLQCRIERVAEAVEQVAAVVIGRNEENELEACLRAAAEQCDFVVYVDSGSTDGSVAIARAAGVDVIELDPSKPLSAARGRNAGWRAIAKLEPRPAFVQFIDGDTELSDGWVRTAKERLSETELAAIACGRLLERDPSRSSFHRAVAIEWDAPAGVVQACGGIFLARLEDVELVGGFDESLHAGEEPELCLRMRAMGRQIHRLDVEMAIHDLGPFGVRSWWQRSKRGGRALAAGFVRHGFGPEAYKRRELGSVFLWAVALPFAVVVGLLVEPIFALAFCALWFVQLWRVRRNRFRELPTREAWQQATLLMAGKFPEALGALGTLGTSKLFR